MMMISPFTFPKITFLSKTFINFTEGNKFIPGLKKPLLLIFPLFTSRWRGLKPPIFRASATFQFFSSPPLFQSCNSFYVSSDEKTKHKITRKSNAMQSYNKKIQYNFMNDTLLVTFLTFLTKRSFARSINCVIIPSQEEDSKVPYTLKIWGWNGY